MDYLRAYSRLCRVRSTHLDVFCCARSANDVNENRIRVGIDTRGVSFNIAARSGPLQATASHFSQHERHFANSCPEMIGHVTIQM